MNNFREGATYLSVSPYSKQKIFCHGFLTQSNSSLKYNWLVMCDNTGATCTIRGGDCNPPPDLYEGVTISIMHRCLCQVLGTDSNYRCDKNVNNFTF